MLSLPLIASIILSALITNWGIPKLRRLKLKQVIRQEGPKAHYQKQGTPTMGGILLIPIGLIIGNLIGFRDESSQKLLAISYTTLAYMVIGGLDDWKSLVNKKNLGLRPLAKVMLQTAAALVFLIWSYLEGWIDSSIILPYGLNLNFGVMIWPLAIFVFIAESNATNLTDGLDGLASGCGALVFTGLAIELLLRSNNGDPVIASFCIAMAGAWLGFLFHNRNPAKVFMGDTGSLAMGAALSGVGLLTNTLWPLLIMSGIFLIESISVIAQVSYFKITKNLYQNGQRILLMAPLHHHYELKGIKEEVIVRNFWMVNILLIMLSLLLRPYLQS